MGRVSKCIYNVHKKKCTPSNVSIFRVSVFDHNHLAMSMICWLAVHFANGALYVVRTVI